MGGGGGREEWTKRQDGTEENHTTSTLTVGNETGSGRIQSSGERLSFSFQSKAMTKCKRSDPELSGVMCLLLSIRHHNENGRGRIRSSREQCSHWFNNSIVKKMQAGGSGTLESHFRDVFDMKLRSETTRGIHQQMSETHLETYGFCLFRQPGT